MDPVTRRRFLQGSAAVGGAVAGRQFLFGGLHTIAPADAAATLLDISEDVVPTTCWIGKQDCGMLASRVGGRVIKVEGPATPRYAGTLCPKGQAQVISIYDPNRIKTSLIRANAKGGTGAWRQATASRKCAGAIRSWCCGRRAGARQPSPGSDPRTHRAALIGRPMGIPSRAVGGGLRDHVRDP